MWAACVVALALVQTPLGHAAKGAPRWLDVGPFNLQPSEMAKVCVSLVLARHLALNEGRIRDFTGVVLPGVLVYVLPPVVCILFQRDLGQVMLLSGITLVALYVAGLETGWLSRVIGAIVGLFAFAAMEPYRLARIIGFIDPVSQADGAGLQVTQGWIAIAMGGVWGTGLGNGVAQQGFLPEAHTDMILAVVGEELGLFGWMTVVLLEFVVLWRGMLVAASAERVFEMVAAACLTSYMAAQVIINVGVIGALLPPKGLVLPFVSYGASAVIFNIIAVAILARMGLERERSARAARVGV
jgi:cell division protein FtsW (lipid II flippase)